MWSGRRGSIRRRTDRKIHFFVDLYDHYLLLSILLIVLLSIFDTYFTIFHVDRGAREINPLMRLLIGYGDMTFFVVKYVVTMVGLFILCIYKNVFFVRTILRGVFLLYLVVFAYHIFLVIPR